MTQKHISDDVFDLAQRLPTNIKRVVKDKDDVVDRICACLYGKGHVHLVDVPGTAKTITARAMAKSVDGEFRRVQFTPDIYPSDIVGGPVWNRKLNDFEDRPGPIRLANIFLGDEVNRTIPQTQSAMLEAMGEGQVTVNGITHNVLNPFFVMTTSNPIDQEGTYPLPEAQLDRFMAEETFDHPSVSAMEEILDAQLQEHPIERLEAVMSLEDLKRVRDAVKQVKRVPGIRNYISRIVARTQELAQGEKAILRGGSSIRGAISLDRMSRAMALLDGRDHVVPEDVEALLVSVLGHRLIPGNRLENDLRHDRAGTLRKFFREQVLLVVKYDES